MNLTCNIVMDLVGVYKDGVVSKKTAEEIQEHLQTCHNCRKYYRMFDRMNSRQPKIICETDRNFEKHFEEISKRLHKKHTINLSALSMIIAALCAATLYGIVKKK